MGIKFLIDGIEVGEKVYIKKGEKHILSVLLSDLVPYRRYRFKASSEIFTYEDEFKENIESKRYDFEFTAEKDFTVTATLYHFEPEGFIEYFVSDFYQEYSSINWKVSKNMFYAKCTKHGADEYTDVRRMVIKLFLDSGWNYKLNVTVIEQASFIHPWEGWATCVSWPNTYDPNLGFVNLCGPFDQIWDYVYHDKSNPEIMIKLGGKKVYRTIMTAAYKSGHRWISDTYAKDTFDLVIEQKEGNVYTWRIENFKRITGKSGRTVLACVDERNDSGEFKLGGVTGTDKLGRYVDIRDVIDLEVHLYNRVGLESGYSYSGWPYCKTEIYIKIEKIY